MSRAFWITGILLVLGGSVYTAWRLIPRRQNGEKYRFVRVERGDLTQTVRATGVVQPTRLVQVGTQVTGPVKKLYVDFNDRVAEGDLVAQIDPSVYEARLAQDQASLAQGLAAVEEAKARLAQAERELERARRLAGREMLSQADLDAATASRDTLAAQVKVAEAAAEQARAALRLSRANLDYTTVRSPVNGVVVSRNVSEGQTVVASMSAQVLFQIATDLRRVQVEASVPEADVGRISAGQPVQFTVDAYDQTFTGAVSQVRLAAASVQNVVTYPVVVAAENPDSRLFPGMTANIVCEVAERTNALKVANAALRFKPEGAAAQARQADAGRPRSPGPGNAERAGTMWVQPAPGAAPEPVRVRTGITDGSFTEIREPSELAEGAEVIAGVADESSGRADVVNPFAPRFPSGQRRAPHPPPR